MMWSEYRSSPSDPVSPANLRELWQRGVRWTQNRSGQRGQPQAPVGQGGALSIPWVLVTASQKPEDLRDCVALFLGHYDLKVPGLVPGLPEHRG